MKLDHIMFAAPDLDQGVQWVEGHLGVRAKEGGSHEGAGTRNALVSLGTDVYLEILAPDPAQPLSGTLGEQLQQLESPRIRTWAVSVSGFAPLIDRAEAAGLKYQSIDMTRVTPDGDRLVWQILFLNGHGQGPRMPFFIDWLECPHPCSSLSPSVSFQQFSVAAAPDQKLYELLRSLDLEAYCRNLTQAECPGGFRLAVSTLNGAVTLT